MIRPLPKAQPNGRIRAHLDLKRNVYLALRMIAEADRRTMLDEVSHLVMERAQELDIAGQVGKQDG